MSEGILRKEIITDKILCRSLGVLTFIILTALGAFVRIPLPFTPVPVTLQTFFVLLAGAFLGSGLGSLSQASYILLGVLGVPLFTGPGSGLLYLSGPTAGYLIGFVLAAFLLGRLVRYCRSAKTIFLSFLAADLVLLGCGIIWLKFILGYSLLKLFWIGFLPFIPGNLLKISAATFIYSKIKSRLREII